MPAVSSRILSQSCCRAPVDVREEVDVDSKSAAGVCDCFGRSLQQQLIASSPPRLQVVCLQGFAFGRPAARRPRFVATSQVESSPMLESASLPQGELVKVIGFRLRLEPFRRREPKLRAGYHVFR
jgi:hypothetical protein